MPRESQCKRLVRAMAFLLVPAAHWSIADGVSEPQTFKPLFEAPADLRVSDDGMPEVSVPSTNVADDAISRAEPDDPTLVRRRLAIISDPVLRRLRRRELRSFDFNLFDDVNVSGVVNTVDRQTANRFVVTGPISESDSGSFTLVVQGDVAAGNVRVPGLGSYQIRYAGGGRHAIREIDESKFQSCLTDATDLRATPRPNGGIARAGAGATCDDDGSLIDLLVVYTADARIAEGGTAAMEALIALSEAETNQAYANSLITTTSVRVVMTYEVDYPESGDSETDRARLSDPHDGYMDEVFDIRNQVSADVVTLLTNTLEVCGRAIFSITAGNVPHPESGFNVVKAGCSAGNFTFGHELGHNQGCRHDRWHDSSDGGAFLYSHGHIDPSGVFRSVMGVVTEGVPRVQYFSNPDVLFSGLPTGVPPGDPASAHNALTIEQTAFNVANFRRSNDCNANGICDDEEIATGFAQDCNGNGHPDDCDGDCNGNGTADVCDIAVGSSPDCTGNGVPDECEPDCNTNGVPDSCDILAGTSPDENGTGRPDECEPPIFYVDAAANGAQTGTSWANAFVSP